MIVGNGGSAAIASHLQNDLCKAAQFRAMVFTEPPLLTALSNDISYTAAYRELVNLWAENDDMLIAISRLGQFPEYHRCSDNCPGMGMQTRLSPYPVSFR